MGCGASLGCLVVVVITVLIVLGVLIETGHLPDSAAVPGEELPEATLTFLRTSGVLGEDEEVLYFYSDGLFSLQEDGNFFTDRRVVSYVGDGDDLIVEEATYPEIVDITAIYDDSLFANSEVLLDLVSGDSLYLLVSNESDLDEEFVELLLATWQENR